MPLELHGPTPAATPLLPMLLRCLTCTTFVTKVGFSFGYQVTIYPTSH